MISIFRRELKSYFTGMIGWAYAAIVLMFTGVFVMAYNLSSGYAQFEVIYNSTILHLSYMIAISVLTMGVFAEERHSRTDQLLYSLPVSMTQVVLAKYLALLTAMLIPALITCAYPVLLAQFGSISLKPAFIAILMSYLLGAALASIGMFISSMSSSQVSSVFITIGTFILILVLSSLATYIPTSASASQIAFGLLICLLSLAVYLYTGNWFVTLISFAIMAGALSAFILTVPASFAGLFGELLANLALVDRFYTVVSRVWDLTSVVYFLSLCVVFVFLTVQALEKRRWN